MSALSRMNPLKRFMGSAASSSSGEVTGTGRAPFEGARGGEETLMQACERGDLPAAQRAFRAGAQEAIRAKNEYGETCMHLACQAGSLHVARWLYVAGAAEDIHAMSNDGDTCMLLASLGGHLPVCRWLHEAGCKDEVATANAHGNNPLHFACRQGCLDVAMWLLEVMLQDADTGDGGDGDGGGTPTSAASSASKVAFVTHQNKQRNTPMHFACRGGWLDVCRWLYAQGAKQDCRTPNAYGWTPTHSAHWKQHAEVVAWLGTDDVGAGEDLQAEDNEGHTPEYWAQRAKGAK